MADLPELSASAHRYLDGERDIAPPAGDLAAARRLDQLLTRYAHGVRAPGSRVDAAVLRRIRPRARGWLGWLLAPQRFSVRPIVLALAAGLALFLWWPAGPPVADTAASQRTVLVRFELLAPEASSVSLAGSFNGWSAQAINLVPSATPGLWTVTVPLTLGSHEYLFVVDGQRWMADPTAHAQVNDGFGQTNSVIVVGPRGVAKS